MLSLGLLHYIQFTLYTVFTVACYRVGWWFYTAGVLAVCIGVDVQKEEFEGGSTNAKTLMPMHLKSGKVIL
jgi:hypothetical protein